MILVFPYIIFAIPIIISIIYFNHVVDSKYTGFKQRSAIGIGAYYRNQDALIVNLLIEKGKYAVGFSYDINASGLARASKSRGGFEITLRMVTPNPFLYQKRSRAMFN